MRGRRRRRWRRGRSSRRLLGVREKRKCRGWPARNASRAQLACAFHPPLGSPTATSTLFHLSLARSLHVPTLVAPPWKLPTAHCPLPPGCLLSGCQTDALCDSERKREEGREGGRKRPLYYAAITKGIEIRELNER